MRGDADTARGRGRPRAARNRSACSSPGRSASLVLAGTLARGDRLPSSRALAADLGVSRDGGRAGLRAAAWPRAGWRPGTAPAPSSPPAAGCAVRPRAGPRRSRSARGSASTRARRGSTRGSPRAGGGPGARCRRPARRGGTTTRAACRSCAPRWPGTSPAPVAWSSTPRRWWSPLGTTDGLRHLLGALPPGPVAVEDPGYRAAVETVGALGRPVRDLPAATAVDPSRGCVAAYVTPGAPAPAGPGDARGRPARPARGRPRPRARACWRTTTTRSSATTSRRCPPWPRWTAPGSPTWARPRRRSRRACGWAGWCRRRTCSTRSTGGGR